MTPPIRTRYAPSPTGFQHVGNMRTALFAWLLARQAGGNFVLRLEDTDQKRVVDGSAAHLEASLKALGIFYDEGPDIGGPFAPYRQSERLSIYHEAAQKLIELGRAYADPYSAEELQAFRETAKANKQAFLYRNHRPSVEQQTNAWDGTTPLRFKSEPKAYEWHDEVMGDLHSGPEVIDDFILIKSDGYPTYNFAHIVDDAVMQITHVIRGQEFISSQPNYFNLYEALKIAPPIFATMPHIMAPSGNKKLSKRDGAKDVLDYLKEGYLPGAMVNFIASLGWNDGTEQEVFSVTELIEKFSLGRVQRSGARFDEQRLLWMNGQHIRSLPIEELADRVTGFWPASATNATTERRLEVLSLAQDRLKTLADLPLLTSYFFEEPRPDWTMIQNNKQLKKLYSDHIENLLTKTMSALEVSSFDEPSLQVALNELLESTGEKPGILFSLIRFSVTWAPFSPGLSETLSLIGKEGTLKRLQLALSTIPTV